LLSQISSAIWFSDNFLLFVGALIFYYFHLQQTQQDWQEKVQSALARKKHDTLRNEVINWVVLMVLFLTCQMLSVHLLIRRTFLSNYNTSGMKFYTRGNALPKKWILFQQKRTDLWNYFHS
jgi:magnesium-transporting ATPase (P-type)